MQAIKQWLATNNNKEIHVLAQIDKHAHKFSTENRRPIITKTFIHNQIVNIVYVGLVYVCVCVFVCVELLVPLISSVSPGFFSFYALPYYS